MVTDESPLVSSSIAKFDHDDNGPRLPSVGGDDDTAPIGTDSVNIILPLLSDHPDNGKTRFMGIVCNDGSAGSVSSGGSGGGSAAGGTGSGDTGVNWNT